MDVGQAIHVVYGGWLAKHVDAGKLGLFTSRQATRKYLRMISWRRF